MRSFSFHLSLPPRMRSEPVGDDLLAHPSAAEPQLPPLAYVLLRPARDLRMPVGADPAAEALGAEDAVELLERDPRERIVLVHDDTEGGIPAGHVVRTGRHDDIERV